MQWYYSKNGTQLGPIGTEEMKAKLTSGEIAAGDLVWKEGMADWVPASQVGELRTSVSPASAVPGVSAVVATTASPYVAPAAHPVAPGDAPVPGAPLSQGMAIGSMICGILGMVTCCLSCLSGPLAIVGVVLGHIALFKVKAEPARFGGKGMAKTGLITGYLGLLATLIVVVFGMWVHTLTPEKIEKMDYLPQQFREEIRKEQQKQLEQQEKIRPSVQ